MSWRTWLGEGRLPLADFNLCDYPTMEELAKESAWELPAKVYSPTPELMAQFLAIMDEEHYMLIKDFSALLIGDGTPGNWRDYTPDSGAQ